MTLSRAERVSSSRSSLRLGSASPGWVRAFADAVRGHARVLVAQTPSYGEGVTFSPLIELLAAAADLPGADAEAVASVLRERLVDEPDGPAVADRLAQVLGVHEALAADASWAVRRLLEVLSADRPLVVILDDTHWAEEPMLDIVESVVDRFHGPLLVLCLARPELLDRRPTWAAGKPRALHDDASPTRARRDSEARRGAARRRAGVCDRARERDGRGQSALPRAAGGDAQRPWIPRRGSMARRHGMVRSRSHRPSRRSWPLASTTSIPPARAILEHASVEGRRFRVAAVRALVGDVADEALDHGLLTLERRGLIDAEDEAAGRWRFAHALIAETAYRGISKELRATLHERLATWLLAEEADQPDVDESAARHLERAFHLREELGIRDESSRALAERAGLLFADAGSRAFAGLDLMAARDLLGRAARLLPEDSPRRLDLLPNLGVALTETGRPDETEALLVAAVEQARSAGSEAAALRARIQLLANRVYRSPTQPEIEASAIEAHAAAEALRALGDGVGLAEAAIAIEYLGMDARRSRGASCVGDAGCAPRPRGWATARGGAGGRRRRPRDGVRTDAVRRLPRRLPTSSRGSPSIH